MAKKKDSLKKKVRTWQVSLTQVELVHIRDLFSVKLPPDLNTTLSQALANSQDRTLIEASLWQKFLSTCREAKLPVGDDSPDFVIVPTAPPPLMVFEVPSDMQPAGECQTECDDGEEE